MATELNIAESMLTTSADKFATEPYIAETKELLAAVNTRDIDALLGLGDEDFAVIDVDPTGQSPAARMEPEWEPWFRRYFGLLDALNATTDSEIAAYRAISTSELGYSVVEFHQHVVGAGLLAVFDCIATIVWKMTDDGWKEARWHCSVVDRDIVMLDPGEGLSQAVGEAIG